MSGLLIAVKLASFAAVSNADVSWHPKSLPLPALVLRCHGKLLVPEAVPAGFRLTTSQVCWVPTDPLSPSSGPWRLAAMLKYTRRAVGTIYLLESQTPPGRSVYNDIPQLFGQGYFDNPDKIGMGFWFWRQGRMGCGLKFIGATHDEIALMKQSIRLRTSPRSLSR